MKFNSTPDWPAAVAGAVIFAGVLTMTTLLWRQGILQRAEFPLYDRFHRSHSESAKTNTPVVLIGITETDIRNYDYPLQDQVLARLLDVIAEHGARSIGLDLYRDLPEPRSGVHLPVLERALAQHTNVFVIRRLARAGVDTVQAPPGLDRWPERSGFNDFPLDDRIDGKVRRALLFADDGTNVAAPSFGLIVASHYLQQESITLQPRGDDPRHLQLGATPLRPLRLHEGGYVDVDVGGFQILLDWRGPKQFKTYSLGQVLGGVPQRDLWKDKVVLVATMAESIHDEHSTPVEEKCFGVTLHAQLIDQLIRAGRHGVGQPNVLREWQEFVLLLGSCLAGVLAGGRLRHAGWLMATLALGVTSLYALNQWAFTKNWWIPIIPSVSGFVPSLLGLMAYRLHREWRDRRILMQLFSQHVSPEIAQLLWRQRATFMVGHRPRPQLLTVTVLFADLRDFTTLAEKTEPSRLIGWLNEYLGVMSAQVDRHGGIVNEYVGDGLMATFGIPIPQQSDAEIAREAVAAVRAAVDMGQALRTLNQTWSAQGNPTAAMRVGIFTGPVVTGSLGSSERLKYAVVGDTVNAAALLQGFDKTYNSPRSPMAECRILVGDPTWRLVSAHFEAELVGSFLLKGRREKLIIHQVFGQTSIQGDS